MATAAGTTRGSRGLPNWAASSTRVARNRLPARVDQVPRRVGEQDVLGTRDVLQGFLDPGQSLADVRAQGRIR